MHPRSFFNEAKLTCIALAIRLAVLERHPQLTDSTSILVIDDLLISLDMGIRRQIIPILLSYADRFQMFIFTHDRQLYYLFKDELYTSGKLGEWKTEELFIEEDPYPMPVKRSENGYIGEAKYFLSKHYYAAAANAARSGLEKMLKRLLPENKKYSWGKKNEFREAPLHEMTDTFLKLCDEIGLGPRFKKLDRHSKLILNPLSHDNIKTQVYRKEIVEVLEILTDLDRIVKEDLVDQNSVGRIVYEMSYTNKGHSTSIEFIFTEMFSQWSDDNDKWILPSRIIVLKWSEPIQGIKIDTEMSFKKAHQRMLMHLSLKKEDHPLIESFHKV